jgi:hypothetical protein
MPVTEFYLLTFFDFGEDISSALNVQKEVDRFTVIDKQLYGLFSVFGNGVVNGWTAVDNGSLSVSVGPGIGIMEGLAVESTFSDIVDNLPPNTTVGIYAVIDNETIYNREVSFVFSRTTLSRGLLLANVTTGGTGVESIDPTVRTSVGFKAIIEDEISTHRHNGISAPKIDLSSEVQGLLPNDRMEDLDAGKITQGRLPAKVLPTIDHQDLKNIGRIPHAGLDSLAQSIQRENVHLFGEVVSVNLLKLVLSMKYEKADVDQYFQNELAIIPGVSDDALIDWDATTAVVNVVNNCISGIPAFEAGVGGLPISFGDLEIVTISWTKDADFKQARVLANLVVDSGVRISTDSVFNRVIDDFEGGAGAIPGGTNTAYTATLDETTTAKALFDSSPYDGNLAGKFQTTHNRTALFTRKFTAAQDWSAYNKLVLAVKNYGATHTSVYISIKNSSGNEIANFKILDEDEVTVLDNPLTNGYALKEFDISASSRDTVASYVLYTGDIANTTEIFFVDSIYLKNDNILLPQGSLRLRYNTSSSVIFNSVEYVGTIPQGTDLRVRVRVADTLEELATATFSTLLSSGETFALNGSYIEIDITFVSDSNRIKTPELESVFLTMLVPSDESGLSIRTAAQWEQGETENVTVDSADFIELDHKNVGDIYFTTENIVNELNPDLNPVVGINGHDIPISPRQGFVFITQQEDERGFKNPKSAIRLVSGNYLICDTDNDRVMEITQDGAFVRGFGSHNVDYSTSEFVVSANYNPRLGVLFIAFSKEIDITNYDLTNVTLYYDAFSKSITLSNATDKVRTLTGAAVDRIAIQKGETASTGLTEKVLAVVLDENQKSKLESITTPLFMKVANDINLQPIEVFNGDFMYFGEQGIYHPVHAMRPKEREWTVLNSRITSDSSSTSSTVSLIQFDLRVGETLERNIIGLTFQYNGVDFSDITLGSAQYIDDTKLLIAGLNRLPTAAPNSGTTVTTTTQTITTTVTQVTTTASGTQTTTGVPTTSTVVTASDGSTDQPTTDEAKLAKYTGTVIVIDTQSNNISFRYLSPDGLYPSDCTVDADGFYTIAESSLHPQSGRIVKLDPFGNVIWITGDGMFTKVNDVRLVDDNHLFVST